MPQNTTYGPASAGEFTRGRQLVDELQRTMHALESRLGRGLDMRRVRVDLDHLRESLALLEEASAGTRPSGATRSEPLVEISDAPYDPTLWRDAGDEGIGSR